MSGTQVEDANSKRTGKRPAQVAVLNINVDSSTLRSPDEDTGTRNLVRAGSPLRCMHTKCFDSRAVLSMPPFSEIMARLELLLQRVEEWVRTGPVTDHQPLPPAKDAGTTAPHADLKSFARKKLSHAVPSLQWIHH